jgi:hypothetical protein
MGIRMKAAWDDGKRKLAAGDHCSDFSPMMEARLVRSGLAVRSGGVHKRRADDAAPTPAEDLTALRVEYRDALGKNPFPGWGAGELRRRIEDAQAS